MRRIVRRLLQKALGRLEAKELQELLPHYHLLARDYRYPLPTLDDLGALQPSDMVGITVDPVAAFALAEELAIFISEIAALLPLHSSDLHLINGSFMAVDAHIYWGLIRKFRPRAILEVGAGQSTRIAALACRQNHREGSPPTELIAVDPYPAEFLRAEPDIRVLEEKIQQLSPSYWQSLDSGDILFLDSSHFVAAGNDVIFEILEMLPRLQSGVLVHFHDISLPKPYPQVYFDTGIYWAEQYLLQAFLAFNSAFEVIWPGNFLMTNFPEQMISRFPQIRDMRAAYPSSEPSSFWIRRR